MSVFGSVCFQFLICVACFLVFFLALGLNGRTHVYLCRTIFVFQFIAYFGCLLSCLVQLKQRIAILVCVCAPLLSGDSCARRLLSLLI